MLCKSFAALLATIALILAPTSGPAIAQTQTLVIGSLGAQFTFNPAISTSAYTANTCLGSPTAAGGSAIQSINLATLTNAQGAPIPSTGNLYITGAELTDSAKQSAQVYAYIFDKAPSGTYTDGSSCALNAADIPVAIISWSSYTNDGAAAKSVADGVRTNGNMPIQVSLGQGNSTLYEVWWTTGTPTYTAKALTAKFTLSY